MNNLHIIELNSWYFTYITNLSSINYCFSVFYTFINISMSLTDMKNILYHKSIECLWELFFYAKMKNRCVNEDVPIHSGERSYTKYHPPYKLTKQCLPYSQRLKTPYINFQLLNHKVSFKWTLFSLSSHNHIFRTILSFI